MRVASRFGPLDSYRGDPITNHIRDFGCHTRPEFAFATSVLSPDAAVFDLGAHVGTFSLSAASRMSAEGRILAVEGIPATARLLHGNLRRLLTGTTCPGWSVVNAFVADPDARYGLREPDGNSGSTSLVPADRANGLNDARQPVVSIDQLVTAHFQPDYLKIDTEGTEARVLMASRYVAEAKPILYFEINQDALTRFGSESGATDLDRFLGDLGYAFFVNSFDRNAAHDLFAVAALARLDRHRRHFDALCVPRDHRMHEVLSRLCSM